MPINIPISTFSPCNSLCILRKMFHFFKDKNIIEKMNNTNDKYLLNPTCNDKTKSV